MKRYIIIKCPKFSKLSFDNILGVKDNVPIIQFFEPKTFFRNTGTVPYRCMYVYMYLIGIYIYLEEYDLDIFKIYLWWLCFIFWGSTSLTLVYLAWTWL